MRAEHAELDAVDALDIQQSSFNQANIIKSLQEHQDSLSDRLEEQMKINFIEALTTCGQMERDNESIRTPDANYHSSGTSAFTPSAANIASDQVLKQLLEGFNDLKIKVDSLASNQNSTGGRKRNGRDNEGRGNNTLSTVNPRTGLPHERYCWSCGCCTHWGKNCPNKKPGHQDDATFKNRKNGNTQGCLGA